MFDLRHAGLRSEEKSRISGVQLRSMFVVEAHIWVRFVYKGIEHLHGLPDAHAGTAAALEVDSSLNVKFDSLFFYSGYRVSQMRL